MDLCYREALHEHVCTITVTESLLCAGLQVEARVVPALPPAALVHVGAILSDGVSAALVPPRVEALDGVPRPAALRQLQAVHPAVS